jgi:hypothetical protein
MSVRTFATLCLSLTVATFVRADNPLLGRLGFGSRCWTSNCPSLGGSTPDYCRKPCPVLQPIDRCGSCDDYCRKPMPCLTDVSRCGECDDYCRKSIPCLLCPPLSPYLYYGPGEPCGPSAKCR